MLIVMPFTRWENLDRVLAQWRKQTMPVRLVLVTTELAMKAVVDVDHAAADAEGVDVIVTRPSIGAAKNAGLVRARELGASWVLFLDDDDYHGPRLVESIAQAAHEAEPHVHALSVGVRFVRFDDGLFLFRTPFAFCPGHCTAARVGSVPDFKTIPRGEDNEWSHRLGMKHAKQLPPWHFIYDRRTSSAHAMDKPAAKFKMEFGHHVNFGDKPDSFVDDEFAI